jgi:hypothetical protein
MSKIKTHIKFEGTIDMEEDEAEVKENPMTDAEYAEDIENMILGDLDEENAKVSIKVLERKETKV